jgi:peptide methionine sulfoxide reductase msrA/msrB
MKKANILLTAQFLLMVLLSAACAQKKSTEAALSSLPSVIRDSSRYNRLTKEEAYIILDKGTERAFTGAYYNHKKAGTYICRQCNNPLFRSNDKFDSGTGWPSFDDALPGGLKVVMDADGYREEIVCANCQGHLGHVFRGEGFTAKQTRHCANSASLNFVETPAGKPGMPAGNKEGVQRIGDYLDEKEYAKYGLATFAGGCFWCTEAAFERIDGVVDVISGYSGGEEDYPSYEAVGSGMTSHAESIRIYFDTSRVSYETLLAVFFVAHDPTQLNRQGPDVGKQYRSAIYFHDENQRQLAMKAIERLNKSGSLNSPVVTALSPAGEFWTAEAYHQDYYPQHPENPYVQRITKPKVEKVEKVFSSILKPEYKGK